MKRLKIYVAARFEEHKRVLEFQARLTRLGYGLTCNWAQHAEEHPGYFKTKPTGVDREFIAMAELSGVERCDALVVFPHPEGASAYAETTVALVLKKKVIAISETGLRPTDRTFFHHPDIHWVKDESEALDVLRMERA